MRLLSEQIVPGSFAFSWDYLVDNELDLAAMDAKFTNDEVGASPMTQNTIMRWSDWIKFFVVLQPA